jgi:hypothetical protein
MLREHWRLAVKEKKEEERGGGTDLWWLLLRLTVVLAGGGEMAVAPGDGLSLSLSPLLLCVFFLFFLYFSLLFSFGSVVGAATVQPP